MPGRIAQIRRTPYQARRQRRLFNLYWAVLAISLGSFAALDAFDEKEWQLPRACSVGFITRKSRNAQKHFGFSSKNWRQPTLAEARQPLPSARLRLTAEFRMGSGRTTALWPPKTFRTAPNA